MKTQIDPRRAEHLNALRRALLERRQATRAQLAEATGLSTMTIGKLLAQMEQRGEVKQDETLRTSSGRPSFVARYVPDYAHFAAICVEQQDGRSAFTLSVYDLFGEQVCREMLLLDAVEADSFDAFFERALAAGFHLNLAVFVLPGVCMEDEIQFCDFDALREGQVLRRIKRLFGVDVLFENDVNGAVFGHAFDRGAQGICAGVYFPMTYCPGAGTVIDGEILRGHRHFAGEVPYMQGVDAWRTLDYSDARRVTEMIAQLVVSYCCIVAPRSMVLYGTFLTEALRSAISAEVDARMQGHYLPELSCRRTMAQDMERGAVRLGLRRMLTLLGEQD